VVGRKNPESGLFRNGSSPGWTDYRSEWTVEDCDIPITLEQPVTLLPILRYLRHFIGIGYYPALTHVLYPGRKLTTGMTPITKEVTGNQKFRTTVAKGNQSFTVFNIKPDSSGKMYFSRVFESLNYDGGADGYIFR
jgi:hypothetical protein